MKKNEFMRKIKALRKKTGLSQEEFAKEFHIPKRTVQNWEEGVNKPTAYTYNYLAEHIERWLDDRKQ